MTKVSCAAGAGSAANNDAADVVFFTGRVAGGRGGTQLDQGRGGGGLAMGQRDDPWSVCIHMRTHGPIPFSCLLESGQNQHLLL